MIANWSAASTSCASTSSSLAPAHERGRAAPRRRRRSRSPRRSCAANGAAAAVTSWQSPGSSSAAKRPGGPEVLAVVEPARRLLARAHVAVPLAARPASPRRRRGTRPRRRSRRRPVSIPGCAVRVPLAVDAAPRAERRQLEPHRPVGREQPVDDADRRRAVRHRQLALEHDPADLPAPARHAVLEVERDEQLVAARVDGAARPTRRWRGGSARRRRRAPGRARRDRAFRAPGPSTATDEQPVVAARAQPGDRAHRVAADAVGDEPLAQRRLVERAAHLRAEADRHDARLRPRRRTSARRASGPAPRARGGSARRRAPSSRSGGSRRARRRCRRGSTR